MTSKQILPHDLLKNAEILPKSVRTLRRAQILLFIAENGPTTNHHLADVGSSLNTIRRLTREFSIDGLVFERNHLYRITSKGRRLLHSIIDDPVLSDFILQEELFYELERPKVTRLNQ